jgi:hypothetical protein
MKENLKRFWVWIWGDSTPSTDPPGASSAYAIGFGVGLNGGSIADAAGCNMFFQGLFLLVNSPPVTKLPPQWAC